MKKVCVKQLDHIKPKVVFGRMFITMDNESGKVKQATGDLGWVFPHRLLARHKTYPRQTRFNS